MLDGKLEPQIDYWRNYLAGKIPEIQLPVDLIPEREHSLIGKTIQFSLSPSLSNSLHDLLQRENATALMGLLTAFKVFLFRYTGLDDVTVGSPIANRNHAEIEDLIGLFMNPLPFRTDLYGDPSFTEALSRVRDTALAAYQNQDVPFNSLVQLLQPDREMGRMPFFQTMFIFQNFGETSLVLPDIESRIIIELDRSTTMGMDIILQMWELGGQFHGILTYRSDLFLEDTANRMLDNMTLCLKTL